MSQRSSATSKRREMPAAVLDFYEPEEIEALARAAEDGAHRAARLRDLTPGELAWRAWEDRQDAELYRVAAYTGMRLGELLALRWEDVDLDSGGDRPPRRQRRRRGPTKSWQARALPLADAAATAPRAAGRPRRLHRSERLRVLLATRPAAGSLGRWAATRLAGWPPIWPRRSSSSATSSGTVT